MSQDLPLLEALKGVSDFRRKQGTRYPLAETLLMIILAIMGGSVGFREIESYLKINRKDIIEFLGLKDRIPSHVTIGHILQNIDYEELCTAFTTWAQKDLPTTFSEQLQGAIDGKSLRSTVTNCHNSQQNFVSMVTLFCKEMGCVLAISRMESSKGSEIFAAREIIKNLTLKGFLLSLDALHCKKDTVEAIIASENDYLIQVKDNQPKLKQDIKKSL